MGAKEASLDKAFESFESAFFNNMIIVLDSYFVHRTMAIQKIDGNPLNEVRGLAPACALLHRHRRAGQVKVEWKG